VTDTDSNYQWLVDKRDSLKCLVATEGEKIVGIHILQKQAQRPKACFIKTLWVAVTHRNIGIATSLKTKGESWAKITGSESIVTNVTVKNPKMLELNKRRGFAPTTIEMEKRLV
jgi:GNAT superfamily N-acetyltransferase